MGRFFFPILMGLVAGVCIGWLQGTAYRGYEERLLLNQTTSKASPSLQAPMSAEEEAKTNNLADSQAAQIVKSKPAAPPPQPAAENVAASSPVSNSGSKPKEGTPRVEIPGGTHYKFGTMLLGESLSHEFMFRNTGSAPLKLEMKSSTCKCTVGALDKSVLEPGEETPVKLTWIAKTNLPDFSQTATIATTDPLKTEVQLVVSGQIGRTIVFDPPQISLGDISAMDPTETKFQMFFYSKDLTLEGLSWNDPGTAHLVEFGKTPVKPYAHPEHSRADKAYEITVKIKPGMRLGPLNAKIIATTNLPPEKMDPLELQVTGRTGGEIELIGGKSFDPERQVLNLGTVNSKEGTEVKLQMALQGPDREKAKPEVIRIVPAESVTVEIGEPRETPTRRLFPVTVRVPVGAPAANFPGSNSKNFGKILIKTGPDSIEVPIHLKLRIDP